MPARTVRDRVLDAACACVARVGLGKTTLDDVAREARCARATVYRHFPGKQPLLRALVDREARRLGDRVRRASAGADDLAGAVVAAMLEAARALAEHGALTFVAAHEPELLLPHLAFEHEDAVLRAASELVAPAFVRFLPPAPAARLGEWIARLVLSYTFSPSEELSLLDEAQVRALVHDFVLPGSARPVPVQGVTR